MGVRTLTLKLDVAARLKIFGRDGGDYVASFGLPGPNMILLPDSASFEHAYVSIEPLAGVPWTQAVDFQGHDVVVVTAERPKAVEPIPSSATPSAPSPSIVASVDAAIPLPGPPSATPLTPFFWTATQPALSSDPTAVVAAPPQPRGPARPRRFSLGLSTDAKPFDYGGWEPFEGPWRVEVSEQDGRLLVMIPRDEYAATVSPEDGFRVRATLAAQHAFVERFLVPFYSGGVRIDLVADVGATSPRARVRPIDPDRYALQQALEAGSDEEGAAVWSGFSAQHDIERYVHDDSLNDPWTVLLVLLAHDRFRSVALASPQAWSDIMAGRFGWISDFLILQAHYLVRAAPQGAPAEEAVSRGLDLLRRARLVGAPYFAGANRILLRLLSSLTSEEVSGGLVASAQAEMARWWRVLDNQSSTGVLFSWRMDKGARTLGGQNSRYATLVASGEVSDGVVRQAEAVADEAYAVV